MPRFRGPGRGSGKGRFWNKGRERKPRMTSEQIRAMIEKARKHSTIEPVPPHLLSQPRLLRGGFEVLTRLPKKAMAELPFAPEVKNYRRQDARITLYRAVFRGEKASFGLENAEGELGIMPGTELIHANYFQHLGNLFCVYNREGFLLAVEKKEPLHGEEPAN